MIVALLILVVFGLGLWYIHEDLRELLREERHATTVGADGDSPGTGVANPDTQGMTATVGADTTGEAA